ncbi:MAG TPA: RecX family transcriptional regulator [Bacteroidota bacterium]|nr:RecX family transcriptional regulator [Bacteroidota bacterium]
MIITKVLRHKKFRDRYTVYIDGGLGFDVSADVLQKFDLHINQRIDDQTVERITTAEAQHRAQSIALNYISYRPRSSKEIVDHLMRKGYKKELAQKIVKNLQSMKYVDDTEFARMFVRDRLKRRPSGYSMLRHALIARGISPAVVEKVLKEYVSDEKQLEAARMLAEKRLGSFNGSHSNLDQRKLRNRIFNYLLRRGFSTEVAQKTVRTLIA